MTESGIIPCSIVIVNYNGGKMLLECLQSVQEHSPAGVEVMVVDNASSDGSVEEAEGKFPGICIVRSDTNRGYSGGNNLGVASAAHDVVVLLNNDTVVTPGWLEPLVAALDRGATAVTARVETEGFPAGWYEKNGTLNVLGYNIMRFFDNTSSVFFAGGTCLAFRRSEVGIPFPEEYFLYQEDVFLSWRLRLAGKDVRMAQESLVLHRGSASVKHQASALVSYYQERNRLLNLLVFYSRRTLAAVAPLMLIDAVVKVGLSAIGRGKNLRGILRAYAWPIAHHGWVRSERKKIQKARTISDAAVLRLMSGKLLESESRWVEVLGDWVKRYVLFVAGGSHD